MQHDKEIDTRGLNCPLPILRTKKALTDMQSGQVLKVLATDPGAVKDFQAFSRQTGHELVSHAEADGSNALTALPAFKAFAAGIKECCEEPPVRVGLKVRAGWSSTSGL